MPDFSAEKLIANCKKQDPKAQMFLYNKHSPLLYTVAFRILKDRMKAEDAMQEVLLKFFKDSIFQLKDEKVYLSYLKKAVANKAIDEWKKDKNRTYLDMENIEQEEEIGEDRFEGNWNDVLKLMNDLPEKYRIIIELYYLQEFSHQDISEALHISYANSRVLLKRAMDKLKKNYYETIV